MSTSEIKVRNPAQAVKEAAAYLNKNNSQNVLLPDSAWQERTLYSSASQDYAVTSKLFTAGDWQIEVFQNPAPLASTVYRVAAFNGKLRRYWTGSVKADGTVSETIGLKTLSEAENQQLTAELARKIAVPAPKIGGYGH